MPDDILKLLLLLGILAAISYVTYLVRWSIWWIRERWRIRRLAPDPRLQRSQILRMQGRRAEALDLCEEVIRTGDAADAAHGFACRAALMLDQADTAAALRDLDEAIRLGPRHDYVLGYVLGVRSSVRLRKGDAAAALADAEQAVETLTTAEGLAYRAAARSGVGDAEGATKDADEAIHLDPRSIRALSVRGYLRHQYGDLKGAVADYDAAIRLWPANTDLLAARASAHAAAGDLAAAAIDLDWAALLAPDDAAILANRGWGWHQRGHAELAIECYEQALQVDPHQSLAANNLAWLLATLPDASRRDGQRASELARQACEATAWQNADSIGTLAAAAAECGDFAEAIRLVERAIELEPSGYNMTKRWRMLSGFRRGRPFRDSINSAGPAVNDQMWRASMLLSCGTPDAVVGACDAVESHTQHDAVLLTSLGTIRRAAGDVEGAIRCCSDALRLDPLDDAIHNNFAWLLACEPDPRFRDGPQAIKHAIEACRLAGGPNFDWIDTLAAAYAEAGDFKKAVESQQRAINVAPASERDDLSSRLRLYQSGQAYRDPARGK